jgi:protein involved in polysaccharide export with SLBB domain
MDLSMAVNRKILGAMLVAVLLAGCTTQQAIHPDSPDDQVATGNFDPWSDAVPPYRIGEGDKIRVMFPLTPEMTEDAVVRPDGAVYLAAAGEVPVASLNSGAASAAIASAATRRLKNPKVEITVLDAVSSRIYVGGEVRAPGMYPVSGPITVAGALLAAGGNLETARLDEVIVLRRSPNNKPMMQTVNVRDVLEGTETRNMRLYQGDIVFVPKTRIAEFDLWIDQFVNRALPFSRNFDYTMGSTTTTQNLH